MLKPLRRNYRKYFTIAFAFLILFLVKDLVIALVIALVKALVDANIQKLIEQKKLDGYLVQWIGKVEFLYHFVDNAYCQIFLVFLGVAFSYFIWKFLPEKKPLSDWNHSKRFTVWQAACLIHGKEPQLPIIHGTPPYSILKILRQAIEDNELPVFKKDNNKLSWSELEGVAINQFLANNKIKSKFNFPNQNLSENLPIKSTNLVSKETSNSILDVIAKYNQVTGNYVYNSRYPKDKTQQYQNDLEAEFSSLLAMREVMLDKDLEQLLRDIRQIIAIILYNAMSVEHSEIELRKKRSKGAISNHEYMQEMPDLHKDFLKYKDKIIGYLRR